MMVLALASFVLLVDLASTTDEGLNKRIAAQGSRLD
jgi:hypothetical protein